MSSLSKMLSILELFEIDRPLLSAEQVQAELGLPRTTVYRYLKALVDAGVLARFARSYSVGPKAIELDYILESADPLMRACVPPMVTVSAEHECDFQIVGLSGRHIIVLQHVRHNQGMPISFGRGRRMPFFRGAGAKIVMSHLPGRKRRAMLTNARREAEGANLDSAEFARVTRLIRRRGYYCSEGELDTDTVGVGMPISHPDLENVACLVMVVPRRRLDEVGLEFLLRILSKAHAGVMNVLNSAAT